MRSLSAYAKREINQINSGNVYLDLLTISHPDLTEDIRIVNNNENVTSNGLEYLAFNFRANLPTEDPDSTPSVTLSVDNVDRAITDSLMSISSPASIKLQVVLSDTPDEVEIEKTNLLLRMASYDALEVTGTITSDDILSQAFPAQAYTPTQFKSIL